MNLQNIENSQSYDKNDGEITQEKILFEKYKAAQYYQKLLIYTLDDCLMKFCRRNVDNYMRAYIENCISISFFRVARFQ